jgi:hypothetical protein
MMLFSWDAPAEDVALERDDEDESGAGTGSGYLGMSLDVSESASSGARELCGELFQSWP